MTVRVERTYDFAKRRKGKDEYAVLVDRVWPRGLSKESLGHDEWLKSAAPSSALRRWFAHDPAKWAEFRSRYRGELKNNPEVLERLKKLQASGHLTLLYSARDTRHNQAVALVQILNGPLSQ